MLPAYGAHLEWFPGHQEDAPLVHADFLSTRSGEGHGSPLRILAWEITWTEGPGRLESRGSQESETT